MELKPTHLALLVLAILAASFYNVSIVKAQYPYQYPPPLPLPLPLPSPPPQQSSSSSCVNKLFPCLKYLNSTRDPPHSCCDPLKSVIKSEPECLCKLISTQGAFQAQLIGINVSDVELLPGRCGQHVNPIGCLIGSSRNSVHGSAGLGSFPSLVLLAFGALLIMIIVL